MSIVLAFGINFSSCKEADLLALSFFKQNNIKLDKNGGIYNVEIEM